MLDLRGKFFELASTIFEFFNERIIAFLAFFQNFPERIQSIYILRAIDQELIKAVQDCAKPPVALRKSRCVWLRWSIAIDLSIIVRETQFEQLRLVITQICRYSLPRSRHKLTFAFLYVSQALPEELPASLSLLDG